MGGSVSKISSSSRDGRASAPPPPAADEEDDEHLEDLSDEELEALLRAELEGLEVDETARGVVFDDDDDVDPEDFLEDDDAPRLANPAPPVVDRANASATGVVTFTDAPSPSRSRDPSTDANTGPRDAPRTPSGRPRGNPLAAILAVASAARRRASAASRDALGASAVLILRAASDVAARPKRALAGDAARLAATSIPAAAAHAILDAATACLFPNARSLVRCGALVAAVAPLARRASSTASMPATRLAASKLAFAALPVSPDAFADAARRVAPAAKIAARLSRAYLRSHVRYLTVRFAARRVASRQTRRFEYATRVAPIVGAYAVKKRVLATTIRGVGEEADARRRDAWDAQHRWGAARAEGVIRDFGGFYRKVGQIMGTARQMMPEPYLEAFSATMDNNPPTKFARVRRVVERSLGAPLDEYFAEFDPNPVATASIAQVHAARLRSNGKLVVVKVLVSDKASMVGDVRSMLHTALALQRLGLDNGVDLPTVFRAYLEVIEGEFDFTAEAAKIGEFRALFEKHGLDDRVTVPEVEEEASTSSVLVMRRVRGTKLLAALNRARASNRRPKCPATAAARHANGGVGWDGVFDTVFKAWGLMLLRHGHYHSDPHPGNFILQRDGKIAILDWGQTQVAPDSYRMHLCRLTVAMAAEDFPRVADEVRAHSQVRLERPTTEAISALCYAYFDTRPTPLAEVNMLDMNNSPFLRNRITRNTQEGFFTIRTVFLLRGMMTTCGVTASMVVAWEEDARAALREAGIAVPSRMASRGRRLVSRTWLSLQRSLNVGAGARLNTLEAYAAANAKDDAAGDGSAAGSFADVARRVSTLW